MVAKQNRHNKTRLGSILLKFSLAGALLMLLSACYSVSPNHIERSVIEGFAEQHESLDLRGDEDGEQVLKKMIDRHTKAGKQCVEPDPNEPSYVQVLSSASNRDAYRSLTAILQHVLSCDINLYDYAAAPGCSGVANGPATGNYDYGWDKKIRSMTAIDYIEQTLPILYDHLFAACLAEAVVEAFESLNTEPPTYLPRVVLIESWIEMCGTGERSYSEFRHMGRGGAGAASASGTDALLMQTLIDAGASHNEAINAIISAFHDNGIRCPTIKVSATEDTLPARNGP